MGPGFGLANGLLLVVGLSYINILSLISRIKIFQDLSVLYFDQQMGALHAVQNHLLGILTSFLIKNGKNLNRLVRFMVAKHANFFAIFV